MADAIQIPGYEEVIPNRIYVSDIKDVGLAMGRHLFQFVRHGIPSNDQVLEEAKRQAERWLPALPPEEVSGIHFLSNLINGDETAIEHFENHYNPEKIYRVGHNYLEFSSSRIGPMHFNQLKAQFEATPQESYLELIQQIGEFPYLGTIRLEDGGLPKREELESLLKQGVRDSDVYRLDGKFTLGTVFRDFDLLKLGLCTPHTVNLVQDNSDSYLEGVADHTLGYTLECERDQNQPIMAFGMQDGSTVITDSSCPMA